MQTLIAQGLSSITLGLPASCNSLTMIPLLDPQISGAALAVDCSLVHVSAFHL